MIFGLDDPERRKWLSPYAWAVTIHVAVLGLALFVPLRGYFDFSEQPKLSFKLKEVEKPRHAAGRSNQPRISPYLGNMRFASSQIGDMAEPLRGQPSSLPAGRIFQQSRQEAIGDKKADLGSETSANLDAILIETEKRQLSDRVQVPQRSTADFYQEQARKSAQISPVSGSGLVKALEGPLSRLDLYSPKNVSIDAEEGMPGFTPAGGHVAGNRLGSLGNPGGFGHGDSEGGIGEEKSGIAKYEALDAFLDIDVYTYQDPKTSAKYFMINIFPKPGQKPFKVIPKEILFTIDASLSISRDRLDEVKRGMQYCLAHLNKGDVFNVLAFKDKTISFSPVSVPATPETLRAADRFVSGLTASEQTDVYSAFRKIVDLPPARIPSDVMLISDGRPTHGLVDSREVINSTTQINRKLRPVFAFSGGARVNRYLLDFIAYQNRGWSEYIRNYYDIHHGLAKFYDKIKDPIFLNLRYRLNGLEEREVFPKSLPDFYANAEFTLYGSYKDEDNFSMQFLGDVDGKTKELIFTRSLSQAKPGTQEIMKGYAFNKIYYLISRMTTEGRNPAILKEIHELSRRYGITTPYSPEIEKKD